MARHAQHNINGSSNLHIAMFPWFALGHITPFLHLSNDLAARGHKISFLLPPKAQTQLHHSNLHPDLITFYPLSVPHVDGLPPGTQTACDIPISMNGLLASAMDACRPQVEALLLHLRPDFVFYDTAYWAPQMALQLGFKTLCYNVVSAAALAIALVPAKNVPKDRALTAAELVEPPPGYPSSTVVLRPHEAHARPTRGLLYFTWSLGMGFRSTIASPPP